MNLPANARIVFGIAACVLWVSEALAHPSSGIVVDEQGRVFVADVSRGLLAANAQGKLAAIEKTGGHWLALDSQKKYSRTDLDKWFGQRLTPWLFRLEPGATNPALIVADGMPLVVHRDGKVYYAKGNLEITQLAPDGKLSQIAPTLKETTDKLGGIKGLASGPDDALYIACPSAVLKVTLDGASSTLVDRIALKDCDADLPANIPSPGLRGLAVDERGVVFAAATDCRRLIKIASDGQTETVLAAEAPWSPTGVAIHRDNLYVLEYTNANSDAKAGWLPRVRKASREGKVSTLWTVTRPEDQTPTKKVK